MSTEAALALWALSYAATDTEAHEWAAKASARGATSEQIDDFWAKRQELDAESVQIIGGNE